MSTKYCKNCQESFTIEPEDFEFYKKINVPPPTFCWKCRFQRRLAWRNERKMFRNKSVLSGKDILSLYPVTSEVALCTPEEFVSDSWDELSYGKEYDFNRTFFEQIRDLAKAVPRSALSIEVGTNVNSDYVANAGWNKNCYLIFNAGNNEDSAYGNAINYCKNCFDNSHIDKCERCYGSFWVRNSYQTHFSARSIDCTSSMFCFASKGLTNCFGCVNMTNKSYCIYNVQYSKEEHHERIAAMKLNTWSGLQKAKAEAMAFALKFPIGYLNGVFNTHVTGEYISDSKNTHYGYLVRGGKDLKYVQYLERFGAEDSYDLTIWGDANVRGYENTTCGLGVNNSHFCLESWPDIVNSEYCMFSRNISDCFGCMSLRNKRYCIFNKQYSKEEYEILRKKIIAHMDTMPYVDKKGRVYKYGEFFPIEHSPFGYNISTVSEHFPLTKEQAIAKGYSWYDAPASEHKATMLAAEIPDAIEDIPDAILKEILECIECGKAYRIIEMELAFLRQEKLPIPRQCIDCRHNERIAQRAKAFLYHRKCMCNQLSGSTAQYQNFATHEHGADQCPTEFETAYPDSDPRIIYCLKCLYAEVN